MDALTLVGVLLASVGIVVGVRYAVLRWEQRREREADEFVRSVLGAAAEMEVEMRRSPTGEAAERRAVR